MKILQRKIEEILAQYAGTFAFVIENLCTGERCERSPQAVFPAASMIKVAVMYEIMRQASLGQIDLEQEVTAEASDRVDGAGILKELRPELRLTVRELVTLMIVVSDNTATNMLLRLAGMEKINACSRELGLTSTVLARRMMDFEAAAAGRDNVTCAADMARLLSCIAGSRGVNPDYGAQMLDILKRQQVRDKLPFYLPEDTVIANKTGTLPGVEHDGGILYLPNHSYIVCVLTSGLAANQQGIELVARIGKAIYDYDAGR